MRTLEHLHSRCEQRNMYINFIQNVEGSNLVARARANEYSIPVGLVIGDEIFNKIYRSLCLLCYTHRHWSLHPRWLRL